MAKFNIERNELDYILTDVLPNEISEIYTHIYFYDFLNKKANSKNIKNIILEIQKNKQKNLQILVSQWASTPLDFNIIKKDDTFRKMSILQPISVLNVYFFIHLFKKTILNVMNKPCFSIRYHKKNTMLYYSSNQSRLITYLYNAPRNIKRRAIEQSGSFFKISPYSSIISFTNSYKWEKLMLKYPYFMRLDYKSCFDSIYTHMYNWIICDNVNDAKKFVNSHLFSAIDRLAQNINGRVSNGIIVGPEFSRMLVEILLQHIDNNIKVLLEQENLKQDIDYSIYRYVDDFFIFTKKHEHQEIIIRIIEQSASDFRLHLNVLKIEKFEKPFLLTNWFDEMKLLLNSINKIFNSKDEIEKSDTKNKISINSSKVIEIKKTFDSLIAKYSRELKTIVSYVLSIFVNKIGQRTKDSILFEKDSNENSVFQFLDIIFKIYVNNINFENTQRLISILYSLDYDIDFSKKPTVLQNIINKYAPFLEKKYINDYINLFLIISKYNVSFPVSHENDIFNYIKELDDPIILATYLIYSQYNNNYFQIVKTFCESIILYKIAEILEPDSCFCYRQLWYLYIFYDCPHISQSAKDVLNQFALDHLRPKTLNNPYLKAMQVIFDFLDTKGNHFIIWQTKDIKMDQQIAYRTFYKTIFRNYGKKKNGLIVSIN